MKDQKVQLQKWCWWEKGECVVEVLGAGHFPTTAMVQMPDDSKIEVDIVELLVNFD